MSLVTIPRSRREAAPAVPSSAPAPRALIDYDFQNVLTAPPKRRLVLWLMVGLVAAAAAALAVLKVDIIVSANGKIVTSDSEIVIQPVETAVVRSIAVRMGQHVKAGDVLATLDPTFTQADRDELAAKLRTLNASFDRLDAELAGRVYEPRDPNPEELTQRDIFRKRHDEYLAKLGAAERKVEQYKADLAAHKTEAKSLQEQILLGSEAESIYQQLVAKDLASKLKLIEASQRLVDAKTRLDTNLGEQQKLAEQIAGAEAERDGFIQEWQRKLSEEMAQTRSDRDAAAARLSKARMRNELAVMTAPEDATVLEVAHRPAGSVLREAETLMRLVPTGAPLLFEVQVDTRDVARLISATSRRSNWRHCRGSNSASPMAS
jgi:hemolysin D